MLNYVSLGYHEGSCIWNQTLIDRLIASGMFTSAYSYYPKVLGHGRGSGFCVIKVNGISIAIDTFDTPPPISRLVRRGYFHEGGLLSDIKLILKIQYNRSQTWQMIQKHCPVPITSWTMFPNHKFPEGYFQWENKKHKYFTSAHGTLPKREGRTRWVNWIARNTNSQRGWLSPADHMAYLKECRWGVIIKGHAWGRFGWHDGMRLGQGDGKNRREVEYSSCGMPLAMNYRPCYPFPFLPGRDYVLLRKPSDIAALEDKDIEYYARRSKQIYEQYFSPRGMTRVLFHLIKKYVDESDKLLPIRV